MEEIKNLFESEAFVYNAGDTASAPGIVEAWESSSTGALKTPWLTTTI
jgi:hypothetical protein